MKVLSVIVTLSAFTVIAPPLLFSKVHESIIEPALLGCKEIAEEYLLTELTNTISFNTTGEDTVKIVPN